MVVLPALLGAQPSCRDVRHDSRVFHESRNYRIFLPRDYETSTKRYPVINYFHGHSDCYTLEHYDAGLDTVPKITAFVQAHDVLVVAPDGHVARDYGQLLWRQSLRCPQRRRRFRLRRILSRTGPPYRRDLAHDRRPSVSRHLGVENGRIHEPVSQRTVSRVDRKRVSVQPGARVLRRR